MNVMSPPGRRLQNVPFGPYLCLLCASCDGLRDDRVYIYFLGMGSSVNTYSGFRRQTRAPTKKCYSLLNTPVRRASLVTLQASALQPIETHSKCVGATREYLMSLQIDGNNDG
ncbi:hypothetical protein ISCGN_019271 [Ixodes scapularis]